MPDATTIPRVRWRERQALEARDLSAEQRYHLAQRRRHAIGHHGWGVVRGLALRVNDEGVVEVAPGYGVDGYGRELVLPAAVTFADALGRARDEFGVDARVAVWLLYGRAAVGGAEGRHRRWREVCRLRLTSADGVDPRCPPGVPEEAFETVPHRPPPDDPEAVWPLFLGVVRVGRVDADDVLEVDVAGRPLATLRGGALRDPAGRVRIDQGSTFRVAVKNPAGAVIERLSATADGTALRGRLRSGSVAATSLAIGPLAAPPEEAAPGRLYRVPRPGGRHGEEELRIELAADALGASRFAVGGPRVDDSSATVLVAGAGTGISVDGDAKVLGRFREGAIPADLGDPRFVSALTQGLLGALGAASERLSPMRVEIVGPPRVMPGQGIPYTVTVENPNPEALEDVKVFVDVSPSVVGGVERESVCTLARLEPHGWASFEEVTAPVHDTGPAVLRAEALATGPLGDVRHAARTVVMVVDPRHRTRVEVDPHGPIRVEVDPHVPIRVEVATPRRVVSGEGVPYTVTVENPNLEALDAVAVVVAVLPVGADGSLHERTFHRARLEPNGWAPFEQVTPPVEKPGTFVVRADATAEGPEGAVYHTAQTTVEVVDPPKPCVPSDPTEGGKTG